MASRMLCSDAERIDCPMPAVRKPSSARAAVGVQTERGVGENRSWKSAGDGVPVLAFDG
jgi:hypothetical protein